MKAPALVLSALAVTASFGVDAFQDSAATSHVERRFANGGRIQFELAAGEYTLKGTDLDSIRVRWSTRKPQDAARAGGHVTVQGTTATVMTHGPKDGFRVEIDLPRRADLDVNLSAGELSIRGVEGSKNVSMWAGEVSVEIGDPSLYRKVDASVRFGELDARPFDTVKGGIFRSFSRNGSGKYTFRARLFAGELTLTK